MIERKTETSLPFHTSVNRELEHYCSLLRIVVYLSATGFQVELNNFDVSQIQFIGFSISVACLIVKKCLFVKLIINYLGVYLMKMKSLPVV